MTSIAVLVEGDVATIDAAPKICGTTATCVSAARLLERRGTGFGGTSTLFLCIFMVKGGLGLHGTSIFFWSFLLACFLLLLSFLFRDCSAGWFTWPFSFGVNEKDKIEWVRTSFGIEKVHETREKKSSKIITNVILEDGNRGGRRRTQIPTPPPSLRHTPIGARW